MLNTRQLTQRVHNLNVAHQGVFTNLNNLMDDVQHTLNFLPPNHPRALMLNQLMGHLQNTQANLVDVLVGVNDFIAG